MKRIFVSIFFLGILISGFCQTEEISGTWKMKRSSITDMHFENGKVSYRNSETGNLYKYSYEIDENKLLFYFLVDEREKKVMHEFEILKIAEKKIVLRKNKKRYILKKISDR